MNNPMSLLKAYKNPYEFVQGLVNNSQVMKNPVAKNTIEMMQKGDSAGLEETARNLYKEMGMDADEALKQLKSHFGM